MRRIYTHVGTIFFLVVAATFTTAAEVGKDIEPLFILGNIQSDLSISDRLRMAKFLIINGHTQEAKYILEQIQTTDHALESYRQRYMNLLEFLDGNYRQSLEWGSRFSKQAPHLCVLNIINKIVIGQTSELEKDFVACSTLTSKFSKTNHFWLTNMIKIHKNIAKMKAQQKFIASEVMPIESILNLLRTNDNTETLKQILKLIIVTDMHKDVFKFLYLIPEEAYTSHDVRELLGLINLKMKFHEQSVAFVKDIDSATSYNIRGSNELRQGHMELALGHFMLALKIKHNSTNALERAILLALYLEKWELAEKLIHQYQFAGVDPDNLYTLDALMNLHMGNHQKAWTELNQLRPREKNKFPKKILAMKLLLTSSIGLANEFSQFAEESCKKFDITGCWILSQDFVWPDHLSQIKSPLKSPPISYSVADIINTSTTQIIDENIFIDQAEIEKYDEIEQLNHHVE